MDDVLLAIKGLAALAILGIYQKLFQEMFYALAEMRKLAKTTFQKSLTKLIGAFLGFIGIAAIVVFFAWKDVLF